MLDDPEGVRSSTGSMVDLRTDEDETRMDGYLLSSTSCYRRQPDYCAVFSSFTRTRAGKQAETAAAIKLGVGTRKAMPTFCDK